MLVAVAAQNVMLDRMWATAPGATVESGLLTGDPRGTGVEVTGAGYARVPVSSWAGFWEAAVDGTKRTAVVQFPDATGDWSTARWEGLWVDGVLWDAAPLADSVTVTAGPGPAIRHTRSFNTTGI